MKKIFIVLLVSGVLLGLSNIALAFVNESWDWHNVDGKAKRTLHYCASTPIEYTNKGRVLEVEKAKAGLPENWNKWLTEAVDKWNKANTGWKLVPTEFKIPPCQVVIAVADFDEGTTGGGMAQINDTDNDGKMDLVIIVLDEKLENTLKDLPAGQDNSDGSRDGWSTDSKEQTRDPIGVLEHELGHALRLDHHLNSKHDDKNDPDVTDPRKPGDHKTDLSDEDKDEAKASNLEGALFPNLRPCYRKNHFNVQGVAIDFEANSFKDMNDMPLHILSGTAIPNPITLEGGYSHIIDHSVIWFKTELPILKPLSISIPYTDVDLAGGNGKWIGDYHGLIPPALDESTLAVFKYVEEPFGVYAKGSSHWEKIDSEVKVDTSKNKVTFQTTESGIFGLSAMPKAGETTIDQQIAASEYGKTAKAGKGADTQTLKYVWGGLVVLAGLGGLAYWLKPLLLKGKK